MKSQLTLLLRYWPAAPSTTTGPSYYQGAFYWAWLLPSLILPSSCDNLVNYNRKWMATIDAVAPVKLRKVTSKQRTPWMSEETNQWKRDCRKAEQKCTKSKWQIHYDIVREQLAFRKVFRPFDFFPTVCCVTIVFISVRRQLEMPGGVDYSTNHGLINPTLSNQCELSSTSKCDEFVAYFRDKIRLCISQARADEKFDMCPSLPRKSTMDLCSLVDTDMLRKVI
jgi:hypothetical protein